MATRTTLTTVLSMNNTKFKKGLQGSQKQLTGFQKQIQSMKGMIAGAFAVTAITTFTRSMFRALDAQRKAEAKVAQAIKSTGGAAGLAADELNKLARSLQKVTLFGDEQILGGVTAQLLTFTNITEDVFKRTQQAVLDVATVLDQDLKTTAIMLGKALNDPVANLGALGRSGIQFEKTQKALIKSLWEVGSRAEAQRIILVELEKQYGGQARAAADVDVSLTQLKNKFGDFKEALASIIVAGPVVENTIGMMKSNVVSGWQKFLALFSPMKALEIQAIAGAYEEMAGAIKAINDAKPEGGNFFGTGEDFFHQYARTQTGDGAEDITPTSPLKSVVDQEDIDIMGDFISQLVFMAEAYGKVRDAAKDSAEGVAKSREEMAYFNDTILRTTTSITDGHVPAIKDLLMSYEQLQSILNAVSAEKAGIDALNKSLESLIEGAITQFAATIGRAFATDNLSMVFDEMLNIFGSFVQQMGALFIAYGVAFYAFQKIKNPYVLIAAGIALVAIGAAITSSHSSFSSNPRTYSGGGGASGAFNTYVPTDYSGRYAPSQKGENYSFTVRGDDLVTVLDRQKSKTGRYG